MGVEIKYDEPADRYEIGGDVDGQFVAFATVDGPVVRSRVENANAADQTAADEAAKAKASGRSSKAKS